ncbi:hypothetical protein [Arthrobacter sp. ISL-69]|uniref:hypothetical protein n=1 Tax=Arthrobacter sp. ISL-69 TaxID=2819113 RepID=UPI001BE7760F|nr:hypothetical protein [Arthrobacter sp. ISL-69]MBT2538464.1 hypothetical protein [Arthrobacter sp. ISL-69]
MKHRSHALATLAIASLLLTGCAVAAGTEGTLSAAQSDTSAPSPPVTSPETGHAGGHSGGHHGRGTPSPGTAPEGPSDAALMVCGDQPMDRLTSILDLKEAPHTINTWADSTFTCIYHLQEGELKISAQEASNQATALTYFNAMQALAKDAKPIKGLANLGFPAYETTDGSAVFQKDNFILHVNASDLPATLGPENITRNALAYQLSTTILACWVEHP